MNAIRNSENLNDIISDNGKRAAVPVAILAAGVLAFGAANAKAQAPPSCANLFSTYAGGPVLDGYETLLSNQPDPDNGHVIPYRITTDMINYTLTCNGTDLVFLQKPANGASGQLYVGVSLATGPFAQIFRGPQVGPNGATWQDLVGPEPGFAADSRWASPNFDQKNMQPLPREFLKGVRKNYALEGDRCKPCATPPVYNAGQSHQHQKAGDNRK